MNVANSNNSTKGFGGRTYDKVTNFGGRFFEAQLNALSYFENEILVLGIIPPLSLSAPPPPSFNHELLS